MPIIEVERIVIGTVDKAIIGGYFFLVLAIDYVLAKRTTTGSDYFLAGNRLGWAAIGFHFLHLIFQVAHYLD